MRAITFPRNAPARQSRKVTNPGFPSVTHRYIYFAGTLIPRGTVIPWLRMMLPNSAGSE
jgi:hypothetical protein